MHTHGKPLKILRLASPVSVELMVMIFSALSDDSTIEEVRTVGVVTEYLIKSRHFREVEFGELIPELEWSRAQPAPRKEPETIRVMPIPPACICDFAYTGLRAHKAECPMKTR